MNVTPISNAIARTVAAMPETITGPVRPYVDALHDNLAGISTGRPSPGANESDAVHAITLLGATPQEAADMEQDAHMALAAAFNTRVPATPFRFESWMSGWPQYPQSQQAADELLAAQSKHASDLPAAKWENTFPGLRNQIIPT